MSFAFAGRIKDDVLLFFFYFLLLLLTDVSTVLSYGRSGFLNVSFGRIYVKCLSFRNTRIQQENEIPLHLRSQNVIDVPRPFLI